MKAKNHLIALFILLTSVSLSYGKAGSSNHIVVAPAVAGWYFRAISGYPAAITFELVVLFKNGEYYEIGEDPLETINLATAKSKYPKAWGTWKKQGATFYLTNYKSESNDYKLGEGNWFPAYAYTPAIKLKRVYERASGGDYGNGTSALTISKIAFVDATRFTEGMNAGISTSNAAAGKRTSANGTYKITGNMITLTYNDGKVVKKSFALGASGSPAKPTNTMIFIGGQPYTDED
ncbi:hypothetical protein ACFQ3S_10525 [Mucilaginibacter terrae]|uniref:hypothetical protein n=1 Tax=Mucilaginibacter terrae TaxID=1955052 RepID=UPI0036381549